MAFPKGFYYTGKVEIKLSFLLFQLAHERSLAILLFFKTRGLTVGVTAITNPQFFYVNRISNILLSRFPLYIEGI